MPKPDAELPQYTASCEIESDSECFEASQQSTVNSHLKTVEYAS